MLFRSAEAVDDVALKYSDTRHIRYLRDSVNDKRRPNGSDIEAIRLLKEDFQKRGLDSQLIMEVGEDFVILSSEQKIRIAALITTGHIKEPVSLDGCESHAKDFTELEMTTYYPVLRRNVKLATIFVPKPGENSDNVEKLVRTFDGAVNDILPSVAQEYGLDPHEFEGRGLDAHSYVGDEGGGLWGGLCKVKGNAVKNKTVSDFFHLKQDINRHKVYFTADRDKKRFEKLMLDAYDAVTAVQAEDAEKSFEKLINTQSTNPTKMMNFKNWWWQRRARWQKWCRNYSSSSASSAEVSNAKSISASGYRKRLLDVVTTECAAAVLEAAEVKRQTLGQRTAGKGPSAADRTERENDQLFLDLDACATAVHHVAERTDMTEMEQLQPVETAHAAFKINTRDTHRSDRNKKARKTKKTTETAQSVSKSNLRYFSKEVDNVQMDILDYASGMSNFSFKMLDTMGYVQNVIISQDSVGCGSPACRKSCHHAVWILHNVFRFSRNEKLIYNKKLSKAEWEKVLSAFPGQLPLARLPAVANPTYSINIRHTNREAKCAVCRNTLVHGDLQASTEGPYRTIERKWILRTFFFCPRISCVTQLPRNS